MEIDKLFILLCRLTITRSRQQLNVVSIIITRRRTDNHNGGHNMTMEVDHKRQKKRNNDTKTKPKLPLNLLNFVGVLSHSLSLYLYLSFTAPFLSTFTSCNAMATISCYTPSYGLTFLSF